jgi:hypothetical protein
MSAGCVHSSSKVGHILVVSFLHMSSTLVHGAKQNHASLKSYLHSSQLLLDLCLSRSTLGLSALSQKQ